MSGKVGPVLSPSGVRKYLKEVNGTVNDFFLGTEPTPKEDRLNTKNKNTQQKAQTERAGT